MLSFWEDPHNAQIWLIISGKVQIAKKFGTIYSVSSKGNTSFWSDVYTLCFPLDINLGVLTSKDIKTVE